MIDTVFATKKGMSQAWDTTGKRVVITKLLVEPNYVVGEVEAAGGRIVEIGYGCKKLKNVAKPLRQRLTALQLKQGVKQIVGVRETGSDALVLGQSVAVDKIVPVGSLVQVQGKTKGRGFAGAVKRYHFHGGPKTHGQSDRWRATGSIGNRTTPGRVWLGKRMPGHYGQETQTVRGLTVVHFDPQKSELWVSGPIPGAFNSIVQIKACGKMNSKLKLKSTANEPAPQEAGSLTSGGQTEPAATTKTPAPADVKPAAKTEPKETS